MSMFNKITGLARFLKLLPVASNPLSTDPGLYTDSANELHYSDGTNDIQITDGGMLSGPGMEVYSDVLGTDFTVTATWTDVVGGSLAQVSSVDVSVTLDKMSDVTLLYVGTADIDSGADLVMGYQIDSNTPVPCFYEQGGGGGMRNINVSAHIENLAPGTYIFKLMAASSGGTDPIIKGANNFNIAKFSVAVVAGGGGIGGGPDGFYTRRAVAASDSTSNDILIGVTSTAAPRTITLSSADAIDGKFIIIKDESGGAGTNNITINTQGAELIDGAASVDITSDYGVVRLYSNGTNWFSY